MIRRLTLLTLLIAALLLSGCDLQTIKKLEREEQDNLKARVAEAFQNKIEVTEFTVSGEGFREGKKKYVIDYVIKLNQEIPGFDKGIPWGLEFSKEKHKWACTKRTGLLQDYLDLVKAGGNLDSPQGFGGFDDLLGFFNDLDQAGLAQTEMTIEQENEAGAQLQEQIISDSGVTSTQRFNVARVFRKIVAQANRQGLAWECTVLNDDVFNAYAVAGGKTFINIGLLAVLDNEDELAFVIAHEVGHNDLKHCVQKIQHAYKASEIDPMLGEIVATAYNILKYPFSKDLEYAADKRGVELMTAAGYSKDGAIDFFNKLKQYDPAIEDPTLQAVNDFISSHPTADDRIKRIKALP